MDETRLSNRRPVLALLCVLVRVLRVEWFEFTRELIGTV